MQKEADCGPSSAKDLTESLRPVVAGSVLAEFENTALYALRDFASSGGTAKEVWYGSSGLSSAHPVGLMGGYLQVCDNLRCARNVQASTQERCSCTRFNGVCPLEKRKPLSVLGHLSQSRFSPLLWPAHLPLLFAACGGVSPSVVAISHSQGSGGGSKIAFSVRSV